MFEGCLLGAKALAQWGVEYVTFYIVASFNRIANRWLPLVSTNQYGDENWKKCVSPLLRHLSLLSGAR